MLSRFFNAVRLIYVFHRFCIASFTNKPIVEVILINHMKFCIIIEHDVSIHLKASILLLVQQLTSVVKSHSTEKNRNYLTRSTIYIYLILDFEKLSLRSFFEKVFKFPRSFLSPTVHPKSQKCTEKILFIIHSTRLLLV